ncbi:Endo-1,3(4)-beta-glucanase 1 [Mizuhopecten yessoensis]|uniref:glucan endo-1,3-beta-D-glucosidase n=2 Tax=Mizuhopecten yessoensis TaxID=6573 RepID=A0A210Q0J0_MIZYE|nr:Endo-1,3(4)-beta-glucanase 1 [Mizuhopecten yessoensis]
MIQGLVIFVTSLIVVESALPQGCVQLQEHPFSQSNPGDVFGTSSEIGNKARPTKVENLRSKGAIPTGHFMTNVIKDHPVPLRLFPYEATMDNYGMTYDAYTMERWYDPQRTDTMQQQSAWKSGEPWNKLMSLGTNLKQTTSGPDGNRYGTFSGRSGVRVGIAGSGEPVITDIGDLHANVMYTGNGGSMEVPIVRGAALLTHLFNNANPIIKPFCLSSINGQPVHFNCPKENSMADAGSGHISGTCSGGTLHIRLDNSKPIKEMNKIQWAAGRRDQWGSHHTMHNCDASSCHLSNDGLRLDIDVPNASGRMGFAINYIGHYILPWSWIDHPEEVSCSGRRETTDKTEDDIGTNKRAAISEIQFTASCNPNHDVEIRVDLGHHNLPGVARVQYALENDNEWIGCPARCVPMHTCSYDKCTRSGQYVIIKTHMSGSRLKLALNVIGRTVLPYQHWMEAPYELTCGGPSINSLTYFQGGGPVTQSPTLTQATHAPATNAPTHAPITKAPTHAPPVTQAPTQATQAPTNSHGTNTNHHVNIAPGTKFIMELNEPGDELPNQTRKFMLYFSKAVTMNINNGDNTITFSPQSGGAYSGLMQLAYLGAGPRGDNSNDNVLDSNLGLYSYKPVASYCASDSANKAYVNFEWNVNNQYAAASSGQLLMVTMPHHVLQMAHSSSNIKNTVYGFKGYEGTEWLLEMNLPRASMEPDEAAVTKIKQNNKQLSDILTAIARDASEHNIDTICSQWDSYGLGKAIGLSARLASISRAFGTDHYENIDTQIKNCLEKWLRVQDSLSDMWKFHYDTVWGGLFLRATNNADVGYGYDFGFPYYNDHHFHLGYFLYAIAYYVKHHQDWGQQHKERVYALARDVGNPSYIDKYFPVVRHKDAYMGFSWATGVVPGQRQEESSSEGLNCYHGLAALGDAYNDDIMKKTGQVTLATEIESVREYFHVRNHNEAHFPPIIRGYGAVGQIAEDNFYVYTLNWPCAPNVFPMRHACLIGIQIIPITAASKYWMDQDWASHIKNSCTQAIHPETAPDYHLTNPSDMGKLDSGWAAFCYAGMAPYDDAHMQMAADYVKDKGPRQLVGGTGAASTLLFIYGRT